MRHPSLRGRVAASLTQRGVLAWALTLLLGAFYVALYFSEVLLAPARWIGLDNKWEFYGALYSVAMVAGGIWVFRKYRGSPYILVRTAVAVGIQISFAFSIPVLLRAMEQPDVYLSYLWPLQIDAFYPETLRRNPWPFVAWSVIGALVLTPILGLFFGKRWYCSWVCGCGGLANTAGDPFRHLSTRSIRSWQLEKVTVHAVLVLSLVVTALALSSLALPADHPWVEAGQRLRMAYGLWISALFAGIIGVVVYPLGGTRVWCRFGCPMAALLGLLQKAGRFRIRVKRDMCISCGLCSKSCEMGIDVRAYAQANLSFTRAACVGCGLCAEVCPRGVLRLENSGAGSRDGELTMKAFLDRAYRS